MWDDPRAVVEAFIADQFRWNHDADQRSAPLWSRRGRSVEAERFKAAEVAKQEYSALLAKFCRPGFVGQSISYGFPPLHDPTSEVVISVTPRKDRCVVRTTMTSNMGGMEMARDFEYRLRRAEGRWYLESVKCVLEAGKYECL